jgi:polysaccharide export outer membrane protein
MFKRMQFWVIVVILAFAVPGRGQETAERKPPAQAQAEAAAGVPGAAQKAATQDPNFIIGAQDVLDISVWKEPELTRVVPVRPDGKISLPLLNDVQAAGLTPLQLAAEISEGLKKFVTSPQVTVIVSLINSQRVYILGEVTRAGAYPMLPGMTVLQGLSSAGGFTLFANTKKIYVLRQENGKQQKLPFNYKEVLAGKHSEQNILLRAGDTIVVP